MEEEHGKGVREQITNCVNTSRRELSIGFVVKGTPAWFIFVGNLGRVEWIAGNRDVVGRLTEDPPWRQTRSRDELGQLLRDDPVELVIFEGCRISRHHPVWGVAEVAAILWISSGQRKSAAPDGWSMRRELVQHERIGGVTNGVFEAWVALRDAGRKLEWEPPTETTSNWLMQVVDPTLQGYRVPMEDNRLLNTAKGRLDWKNRWGTVRVPTVFSKKEWVRRQLSMKELANALDLPGPRVKRMTAEHLEQLTKINLPGKVAVYLLKSVRLTSEVAKQKRSRASLEAAGKMETKRRRLAKRDTEVEGTTSTKENLVANEPVPFEDPTGVALAIKAVKADDAEVPVFLWDRRVLARYEGLSQKRGVQALEVIRRLMMRKWKLKVEKSFELWLEKERILHDAAWCNETRRAGVLACSKAWGASWWDWDRGSALFFWRWPRDYLEHARKGTHPWFTGTPPMLRERQPPYEEEETKAKVLKKVEKVVARRYIEIVAEDRVSSLMYMFHVPKGETDIRMVYDGSRSGLNDVLWAPWFALPRVSTMCSTVDTGTWCGDNDYGEMFLNFPMHPELQKYAGVDLTQLLGKGDGQNIFGVWTRNAMGLKSSPYLSVQGGLHAKQMMLGDRGNHGSRECSEGNPFHWDKVKQNLPGTEGYDPSRPWLYKVRRDGRMAADLHVYIDDVRVTGPDEEITWKASSQVAKCCSWLGLQDAARKRRQPSQSPGAWAGSIISTTPVLTKSVTQERWDKTRKRIRWIAKELGMKEAGPLENVPDTDFKGNRKAGTIPHKQLEQYRGFLVYVSQTFEAMVPYLKGIHLTLDSWRDNRDREGWRQTNGEDRRLAIPEGQGARAPTLTKTVPRLRGDVAALVAFTEEAHPPQIPVRASKTAGAYLWGDASGEGFGNCLWIEGESTIDLAYGTWEDAVTEQSSNFREAYNLILALERLAKGGKIQKGTEVWIFTDNAVAEKTFSKGSSRSKLIHDLCLRLRKLEMRGDIITQFVWVAGTRMIDQGTDGLSRGDIVSGVMSGKKFISFVPISLTAMERGLSFGRWLEAALPGKWTWLDPEGWFDRAFEEPRGRYVWAPAPCLAEQAMEKLCEVKQLHPHTSHVFVCAMLMTIRWRKQLLKASDVCLHVPVGCRLWHAHQHEPLHVSLTCPLMPCSPYQAKERPELVAELGSKMSRVWRENCEDERRRMRKFWIQAWNQAGQV